MAPNLFARLFAGSGSGPGPGQTSTSTSPHPTTRAPRPGDRATLQIGASAFDATVSLRVELWMSVLHRAGGAGAHASRDKYAALLERSTDAATAALIAKDATRTFPGLPRSAFDPAALRRVLTAYAALDPDVKYMQGLNFVAGVLLLHVRDERAAFGLLAVLLLERGLRALYVDGMAALQLRLSQLQLLLEMPATGNAALPTLGAHLESVGAPTVLWAAPWFLTCFASTFPVGVAARVFDVLLGGTPIRAPVLAIARAFARLAAKDVLAARDMEAAVAALRDAVPRLPEARLHEAMTDALATPWTPPEAALVERVDGAGLETVAATVERLARGAARATEDDDGTAGTSPPRPRPALAWAASLEASPGTDGRLPPPPPSPGRRLSSPQPPGPRLSSPQPPGPALARASLTAATSLRRADAALPPADVAREIYTAVSGAAPPTRHARAGSGGSDEWGAFAAAGEGERAASDAAAAALDVWGPFQGSVDSEH